MSRAHRVELSNHEKASCARAGPGVFARTEQVAGQFTDVTTARDRTVDASGIPC